MSKAFSATSRKCLFSSDLEKVQHCVETASHTKNQTSGFRGDSLCPRDHPSPPIPLLSARQPRRYQVQILDNLHLHSTRRGHCGQNSVKAVLHSRCRMENEIVHTSKISSHLLGYDAEQTRRRNGLLRVIALRGAALQRPLACAGASVAYTFSSQRIRADYSSRFLHRWVEIVARRGL